MRENIIELPDYPIPPGETIKETIEANGWSQTELARRMARPIKTVNEIIHGKAAITADTALQLERVLGVTSKFWLNLEANYQMIKAKAEADKKLALEFKQAVNFPYAQMAKMGWVKRTQDIKEKTSELLNFFSIVSFNNLKMVEDISYRKDAMRKASPHSLTAWARRGEILAQSIQTKKYDKTGFIDSLKDIKSLTRAANQGFARELQNICAERGVAVVFVPHLDQTFVNGAARWLKPDKALIQLTIRYKRSDIFWFSFFHEAAHILLHGKLNEFIDVNDQAKSKLENEADNWASDFLINPDDYVIFRGKGDFSSQSIQQFASEQNVASEIVIGRLLHDRLISYSGWIKYLPKLEWKNNE